MSFEELVKKISPTLKRITYKLNGHFSFLNDEDLYQEALLRLLVDFREGKLEDKTDSYILQGCYFHLKNYLRKARDKVSLVSMDTLVEEEGINLEEILPADNAEQIFESLESGILFERIQASGITEREEKILSLCIQGHTVREIGKRLGISHVRVIKLKSRIQDKCRNLREEIKKGYQDC